MGNNPVRLAIENAVAALEEADDIGQPDNPERIGYELNGIAWALVAIARQLHSETTAVEDFGGGR